MKQQHDKKRCDVPLTAKAPYKPYAGMPHVRIRAGGDWQRSSLPRPEVAHELFPAARLIGVLVNPTNSSTAVLLKDLHVAAQALGVQVHVLNVSAERDFDLAFSTLLQLQASALVIHPDAFLLSRSEQLAALAVRHAVPTIFQDRAFVAAGGLMSYGGSTADSYRLAGVYTGRILKGGKPADLSVQQVTKFELIINLKAAKALGLTIPDKLLALADEVIE
jgi:ABC-type uncharacterized transport system substrate-binding protein